MSIGPSISSSISPSIGEDGLPDGAIAQFDDLSITGSNPVTAWINRAKGGASFDLDVVDGNAANLTTLETGVALLTGTAGDYFSTPDSVAASITGDIDIRCKLSMNDWTPAATEYLYSQWNSTDTTRTINFGILVSGNLQVEWTEDGTNGTKITKQSTVATGFTNTTEHWVRVTLDVDNGAAGNDVKFYTSENGINWTQLGATVTTASTTSIFDGTAVLEVGSINTGTGNNLNGKIYRAQIYDGINGTLAVDMDPSRAIVNISTFTADTGEVWTANGDAFVNATGHAGIYSRGGVGLETTAGQTLTSPNTIFDVCKLTLAAPGVDQVVASARSNAVAVHSLFTDESNSDKYTMSQGALLALAEAFTNDVMVVTSQFNGDATSKLTISGVGSVTGDAGAQDYDFGSVFMNQAGSAETIMLYLARIVYDRALNESEINAVQTFLEGKYKI